MESGDGWWIDVIATELKVNNLVDSNSNIVCDSVNKSAKVLLLNVEDIASLVNLNAFTHELVDHSCAHD